MTPDVAVVIAAHTERRWGLLTAAVETALAQSPPPTAVVVVVDHNEPMLARVRAELPGVRAVPNRYQRGVSGARNSGVEATDTPLVAYLDDDEEARPGWLAALTAPFADPAVVGTGGRCEPIWAGRRPVWFPDEFGWAIGASYRGLPTSRARVRNVWSGNMAVRRDAFAAVGGFRVGFGKLADRSRPEDTDLCIRMAAAVPGGHWVYVPDAVIRHHIPADRATFRFFLRRSYQEGRGKIEMARLLAQPEGPAALASPAGHLSSERAYLYRTLPGGVAGALRRAARGEPAAAGHAGAIVVGVLAAAVGVAHAVLTPRLIGWSTRSRRPRPGTKRRVWRTPGTGAPRPSSG